MHVVLGRIPREHEVPEGPQQGATRLVWRALFFPRRAPEACLLGRRSGLRRGGPSPWKPPDSPGGPKQGLKQVKGVTGVKGAHRCTRGTCLSAAMSVVTWRRSWTTISPSVWMISRISLSEVSRTAWLREPSNVPMRSVKVSTSSGHLSGRTAQGSRHRRGRPQASCGGHGTPPSCYGGAPWCAGEPQACRCPPPPPPLPGWWGAVLQRGPGGFLHRRGALAQDADGTERRLLRDEGVGAHHELLDLGAQVAADLGRGDVACGGQRLNIRRPPRRSNARPPPSTQGCPERRGSPPGAPGRPGHRAPRLLRGRAWAGTVRGRACPTRRGAD